MIVSASETSPFSASALPIDPPIHSPSQRRRASRKAAFGKLSSADLAAAAEKGHAEEKETIVFDANGQKISGI